MWRHPSATLRDKVFTNSISPLLNLKALTSSSFIDFSYCLFPFSPTMSTTTTQTEATQPDISYHPDFTKYQLRTERLKHQRAADIGLPEGFPRNLRGPIVWEGKNFTDDKQWTLSLNKENLEEVHHALISFKGS